MDFSALSNDQLHAVAAHLVVAEAIIQTRLPADVKPEARRYRLDLNGTLGQVFSRRAGDWQVRDVNHPLLPDTGLVVFVDFIPDLVEFYVVPAAAFREGVAERHEAFMARVGERQRNPDSLHHRVRTTDVERWLGRWDLVLKPAQ